MAFTEKQKNRIVKDIVNYYENLSESYSEENLKSISEEELRSEWFKTVGSYLWNLQNWNRDKFKNEFGDKEWVDEGFESVQDWQFDKLKTTGIVDYRFDVVKYKQPY